MRSITPSAQRMTCVLNFSSLFGCPSLSVAHIPQTLHFPLAAEAGEAGFAGEELLHWRLFEVALSFR